MPRVQGEGDAMTNQRALKGVEKPSLDELKLRETQQTTALRRTRQQIEDQENAEFLPTLRKQFEGKYFRYKNSSGPDRTWSLYVYCRTVTSSRFHIAIVDTFEVTPGGCKFDVGADAAQFLFEKQITKREWDRALRAFKARVERLGVMP